MKQGAALAAVILTTFWLLGASPRPIRFVVPNAPLSTPGERDLPALVDEYNQTHRPNGSPAVQLIRRGDNFSSLKELIALFLAGDPPELAAIETSELPALGRTRLPKPVPAKLAQASGAKAHALSLPFQRALPVLVADRETLFRIHADGGPLPRTWEELTQLASKIADVAPGNPPLAIPLQGPRGLWIFEAVAGHPLWNREPGGLKTNRELEPAIRKLQNLLPPRAPELAQPEMTWDRSVQDFLDRKSPLLVTTSDALPLISLKASFRWKCGPLPTIGRASPTLTVGGSDLVVTRESPEVWAFLQYLYSAAVTARWVPTGGFLPLPSSDSGADARTQSLPAYRELVRTVAAAGGKNQRARSTDSEVVRAHTEWVSALHSLFGPVAKRVPIETVLAQLDAALAP